jgi:glutamyl-tRNA synthetase
MNEYKEKYSQVHRRVLYRSALDHLEKKGSVFGCDCSRSQLQHISDQEAYPGLCIERNISLHQTGISWRLYNDKKIPLTLYDFGGNTHHVFLPEGKKYFQVRKKDGDAAYQLSSVVDDIHFGIDLIVRGNDLKDSSQAQVYLSKLLPSNTFDQVRFLHHPLLTDPDGRKFSKSAGDKAVKTLREKGNTPKEILNEIGKRLGTDLHFNNWQELGDWMLTHWI